MKFELWQEPPSWFGLEGRVTIHIDISDTPLSSICLVMFGVI